MGQNSTLMQTGLDWWNENSILNQNALQNSFSVADVDNGLMGYKFPCLKLNGLDLFKTLINITNQYIIEKERNQHKQQLFLMFSI